MHRQFEDVERQEQAASYNYRAGDVLMGWVCDAVFQDPSAAGVSARADAEEASAVQLRDDVWRCGGAERIADARAA
ncbi:MAG: hypothetical protein WKF84_18030 [Pyrinomonadaceae bacterium]